MDKFVIRSIRLPQSEEEERGTSSGGEPNVEVDFDNLPKDPGERKKVSEYHPTIQDEVRKKYIQIGPIQPKKHNFPYKTIGGKPRKFNATWFDNHENWLEYSKKKDALFCLPCYLFKPEGLRGGDAFVVEGFSCWNKKDRVVDHVGGVKSAHNLAVERYENLKDEKYSIRNVFSTFSEQDKKDYKIRLEAYVICVKYLLRMGLPFRGHDESEESNNRGNYIELLKVASVLSTDLRKVVMRNPGNLHLTSPTIQKDIVNAALLETLKAIFEELGDDLFALLVDESSDVSYKEQMAIVLRFLNKEGIVVERFVGIVHVTNTSSLSLKSAIDELFDEYKLSMSSIRGQGYDGASNMRGAYGGLKTLIQKDNSSAYYIHCFAHQLQLTLVATAKGHVDVVWFFDLVSEVVNVIGSSCKRRDVFRELRAIKIAQAISNGEIETGKGLNQELGIKRPCDTRWGSHYRSLLNLQESFLDVIDVLEFIYNDVSNSSHKKNARGLMAYLRSFDFVFILHLMIDVLGITNELSQALQKEEQEIVNAMHMVETCKQRLQNMRDNEWDDFLEKVHQFCYGCDIDVVEMGDNYVTPGRPKRRTAPRINLLHYRADVFYAVIDKQLHELNGRFDEVNTELLRCVSCLSPKDGFRAFDLPMLEKMASFYPYDFDAVLVRHLTGELKNYIVDVRCHDAFAGLKGLGDLARAMVETRKNIIYPHVYLLLKLALILPVATATVERAFSAMKYVKTKLRNRMCDQYLNDCLVTYIERDVFESISIESIMYRFQNTKSRRGHYV